MHFYREYQAMASPAKTCKQHKSKLGKEPAILSWAKIVSYIPNNLQILQNMNKIA